MTGPAPFDLPATRSAAMRLLDMLAKRRKGIAYSLAVATVGCGAAAFGIAPMAPDAAHLPQRWIVETVTPEPIAPQLEALAAQPLRLYRNETTRPSDTADSLLRRLGVDDLEAAAFLRKDAVARKLLEGRGGKMVQAQVDESGHLASLVARFPAERQELAGTHFSRLSIDRSHEGLQARFEVAPMATQVRLGSGTIRSTLFAATDEARLPDNIASQMAELFSTDIDFHSELRRGDTFSVAYEALTADGEAVSWNQSAGRVLAAEFINGGRTYSAVWFNTGSGKGSYFSLDGQSKRRSFLASPLEFSRVTSGFSMRLHPIMQVWRRHLGVDYAAPSGTTVRSVGDGVVEFAGWQNGYGNVVQIEHSGDRSTTYAHLSRIDVRKGEVVQQGDQVGAVGATGWATGPHLHFEFKVGGAQQDPVSMAKGSEALTISPSDRERFASMASALRSQLDAAGNAVVAGLAE